MEYYSDRLRHHFTWQADSAGGMPATAEAAIRAVSMLIPAWRCEIGARPFASKNPWQERRNLVHMPGRLHKGSAHGDLVGRRKGMVCHG